MQIAMCPPRDLRWMCALVYICVEYARVRARVSVTNTKKYAHFVGNLSAKFGDTK